MALIIRQHYVPEQENWQLTLSGEIDIDSSTRLKELIEQLIAQKTAHITLECSELSFIDSTGLGVLISAQKRIKQDDYQLTINNPKKNVEKLLHITGLNKIFNVN